jgi:hypothetical protein
MGKRAMHTQFMVAQPKNPTILHRLFIISISQKFVVKVWYKNKIQVSVELQPLMGPLPSPR